MEKNWVNEIIDEAVKEVEKWPRWMQGGKVRVAEGTHDSADDEMKE